MKNMLFPNGFKLVGWLLFVPAVAVGILSFCEVLVFSGKTETVVNDAIIIGITLGAMFIVCSKEKIEDEMTRSIRLASLLNSFYMYAYLVIVLTILLHGTAFLQFMIVNLVLLPIIYVVNFRLEMQRYNRMSKDEEQD